MKIAMPTSNFKLCAHFGHCEKFALVDIDEGKKKIISTTYIIPPSHEPGLYPKYLANRGANFIIANGMRRMAQKRFNEYSIKVITGAQPDSPEKIVEAFLNNSLVIGPNMCDH